LVEDLRASLASPADAIALWRSEAGEARYLECRIAGARRVELPGNDHVMWGSHCDRLLDDIERFVKERPGA
jgi:hypothetical protein